MSAAPLDLSICSILKDEEANIPDLAACLPLDRLEWVAVDTGSRDRTADRLRDLGVTPHAFAWIDDFAAARNFSLGKASRGWILWLDADDRPGPGFFEALQPLLSGPRRAYRFIVRSPREDSRGECFRQIRLFPNHMGLAFEGRIHEQLGTSLRRLGREAADADLEIVHLGYGTAALREAKRRRNLALLETERREHPDDPVVAMEYGNCLYQGGQFAAAEAAYLAFLPDRDPSRCGDAPAGETPGDEALRHFPALAAGAALKLGDEGRAEAWYRLACRWNPSDLQPFYWLGKRALARGELRPALDLFHRLLDLPVAVGKVATDNATVRRNALAVAVLCEMQIHGAAAAPRVRAFLAELLADGSGDLPLDPRVPFEFYRDGIDSGNRADLDALEAYAGKRLPEGAGLPLWEDVLECLLVAGRPAAVLACLAARSSLDMRSGAMEAFRGRALEETGADAGRVYETYKRALLSFPEDPTVLVYFSAHVNDNRLYGRCYADLQAVKNPPAAIAGFLRQIESQGLAGG